MALTVGVPALNLLQQPQRRASIISFCKELDALLGGGFPLGEVTEVCGVSGVGKTQLCMQLALTVQIPAALGGVEGKAVYLDAEHCMVPERLLEMATALHKHLTAVARRMQSTTPSSSHITSLVETQCAPTMLLNNVHIMKINDMSELINSTSKVTRFLASTTDIRLIILDSVAFHYRYMDDGTSHTNSNNNFMDVNIRTRSLQNLGLALHRIAAENNIAIVVVNQMTARLDAQTGWNNVESSGMTLLPSSGTAAALGVANDGSDQASLAYAHIGAGAASMPALGDAWSHICTSRILLRWDDAGVRIAQLVKSPTRPPGIARFRVITDGIRGYKPASPSKAPPATTTASLSEATRSSNISGIKRREMTSTSSSQHTT